MFQRAARCSRMFLSLSALHLSAAAPDAAAGGPLLSLLSVWELQFVQHDVCVCVCTNSDIIISYRWKHMWLSIKVFARGRAKHRRHKSVLLCGRTGVFLLLFFYSVSLETCRCSHTMQTSVVCLVLPPVCVTESSRLTLPPPPLPLRDRWVTSARREQTHRCLATGQKSHVARVGETDSVLLLIVSSFITAFWFHHYSNQIPLLNLLFF